MTHFEYVSIAASFIFALVIARLLFAVPHVLDPARRYWIHTAWVLQVLLMTIAAWWNLWASRTEFSTPLSFLALLSYPAFLLMRAALIVPDAPAEVRSWEEHFFSKRVSFFAVTTLAPINILITGYLLTENYTFSLGLQGAIGAGAVIGAIGFLSASRAIHAVLALASLLGGFVWFASNPIGSP